MINRGWSVACGELFFNFVVCPVANLFSVLLAFLFTLLLVFLFVSVSAGCVSVGRVGIGVAASVACAEPLLSPPLGPRS